MDAITLLLGLALLVSTYLCWLGYVLYSRRPIDATWVIGIGLFLEMIAFIVGLVFAADFPFLYLMVPIQLAFAIPVLINSQSKPLRLFKEPGIMAWLAFIGFCAVSLLWSANQEYGFSKLQILVLRGFLPGLFALIICNISGKVSWKPILVMGSLYAILTLFLGQDSPEYPGRIVLNGANPIWAGRLLLLVVALALWNNKWSWRVRIPVAALCFSAAMGTQSRGPLIAFLLASLFFFVTDFISPYTRKNQKSRRLIWASIMIVASLFIFIASMQFEIPGVSDLFGESRFHTLTDFNQLQGDDNLQGRIQLQEWALALFTDNPLFGSGIGGFARNGENYPHNLVIEILCELGLVGFILWAVTIGIGFYSARGNRLLQVLLLQSFLYTLTSGDLGFNYEFVMFAVLALSKQPVSRKQCLDVVNIQSRWGLAA